MADRPTKSSTGAIRAIIRSELIQVIIPKNNAGQPKTKIQFPDNQNLRNAFFLGIESYTVETIPQSIITAGTPTVGTELAQSIFVTFQDYGGNNFSQQVPYLNFNTLHVDGDFVVRNEFPLVYARQRVNWPKSFIEIADSTLISTTQDEVALFNVYYTYGEETEATARKASFGNKK